MEIILFVPRGMLGTPLTTPSGVCVSLSSSAMRSRGLKICCAQAKRAKDPALRCSTADINTLPIAHLSLVSPSFTLCHSRQWFCGTYSCSHPDLQPRLVCQVVLISLLFTYYYPHTRAYCKARLLTFIASPYIRKLVSATTNYHYSQISY